MAGVGPDAPFREENPHRSGVSKTPTINGPRKLNGCVLKKEKSAAFTPHDENRTFDGQIQWLLGARTT